MLKKLQRTRSLAIWHDHATVLGNGYIMITIHTIYDPAVYVAEKYGVSPAIQTIVEQPEIYILALNSTRIQDQAVIIKDRVECLHSVSEPIISSGGVSVHDIIRLYAGQTLRNFVG